MSKKHTILEKSSNTFKAQLSLIMSSLSFEWLIYSFLFVVISVSLSYKYFDIPIAQHYFHLHDSFFHQFFSYITKAGNALPSILISILGYTFFTFYRNNQILAQKFALIFQSVVLSGIITDVIKWFAGRYRPHLYFSDHLYGFDFFHLKAAYLSFPSGHTTTVFALAMVLAYLFPRWQLAWWLLASLVGISRIVLLEHYLSDVIFGAYVGISSVLLILVLQKKIGLDNTDLASSLHELNPQR